MDPTSQGPPTEPRPTPHIAIQIPPADQECLAHSESSDFPAAHEDPPINAKQNSSSLYSMPNFGSLPQPASKKHHHHLASKHVDPLGHSASLVYPPNVIHTDSNDTVTMDHNRRAVGVCASTIGLGAVIVIAVLISRPTALVMGLIAMMGVLLVVFGLVLGLTTRRYRVTIYRQGPSVHRVAIEAARLLWPCTYSVTTHPTHQLVVTVVDQPSTCGCGRSHAVRLSVGEVSAVVFFGDELAANDVAVSWKRYLDFVSHYG